MFCPKCSQQQPLNEMRFCSQCGFPLGGVALLLDNNGVMPQLAGESNKSCYSKRARMLGESGILTLASWGLAIAATFVWDYGGPFETVAKLVSIVFSLLGLIGSLRFLYAFLFVKESPERQIALPHADSGSLILGTPSQAALPAQRATAISDYPRRSNTREMLQKPSSITERTTKLLE